MGLDKWKTSNFSAPKIEAPVGSGTDWSREFPQLSSGTEEPAVATSTSEPQSDYANMPVGEVAMRAVQSLPGSAMKAGEGLYDAVSHPLDTLGKLGGLEAGAAANLANKLGYHGIDDPLAQGMANEFGQSMKDKYGSMEGFKRTLATDPFSIGMDLAAVAPGIGMAGRAAGLGRIATAAEKVAALGDPVNLAVKAISTPVKVASEAGKAAMAPVAGVKYGDLSAAQDVGRSADTGARSAFNATKRAKDVEQAKAGLADDAVRAFDEMSKKASNEYAASKASLSTDQLSVQPIIDKISEIRNQLTAGGMNPSLRAEELAVLDEMEKRVNGMGRTSAVDLNDLKITLDTLMRDPAITKSRGLFGEIPNVIKSIIAAKDPQYMDMLENWGRFKDEAASISSAFKLGARGNEFSRMKALFSAANQATKGRFLKMLAQMPSAKYLMEGVLGTKFSPWRSSDQSFMNDMLMSGGLFAMTGGHPASVLPVMMASPRLAGNIAYGMGAAERYGKMAGKALGSPMQRDLLSTAGQLPYSQETTDERQGRKAGGRVSSHDDDADQLVRAAERAKKGWNAQTEPLLNQSDEAVAKALEIANRSI